MPKSAIKPNYQTSSSMYIPASIGETMLTFSQNNNHQQKNRSLSPISMLLIHSVFVVTSQYSTEKRLDHDGEPLGAAGDQRTSASASNLS